MDFRDLLEKNKKPADNRGKYKLDELLRSMTGPEAQAVRDALTDPANTDELLAKTITDFGYPIGVSSVRRYRVTVLGVARG